MCICKHSKLKYCHLLLVRTAKMCSADQLCTPCLGMQLMLAPSSAAAPLSSQENKGETTCLTMIAVSVYFTRMWCSNKSTNDFMWGWWTHSQNTPWAPSHPLTHPRAGVDPAQLWHGWLLADQFYLANIGRKNPIQSFNQYPFLWNISIWP